MTGPAAARRRPPGGASGVSRPAASGPQTGAGRHPSASVRPSAVVFDLGGVLIDWDPRHLYRSLFADEEEMERFLAEVTTAAWNREMDAGRPWSDAIAALVDEHPAQADLIRAFRDRWPEMLGGPIEPTVAVLADLRRAGDLGLYALSNWSAETFPVARERFPFLAWFDAILISGEVGVVKPDPRIFRILVERHGIEPGTAVFVDDHPDNVTAARELGFVGLLFTDADALRRDLQALGLLSVGGPVLRGVARAPGVET